MSKIINTGVRLQKALAGGGVDYDDDIDTGSSSASKMPPETKKPAAATIKGTGGRELPAFQATNELAQPVAAGLNKLFSGKLVPPRK